MIMISKFIDFCVIVCFLTKLPTLGILFSTAVNAVFVAKLLKSGILFSNSVSFFNKISYIRNIFFSSSALPV